MINHIWSVLCSKSTIDIDTKNISLFDILERLVVDIKKNDSGKYPNRINIPLRFEVVSMWHRSELGEEKEFETRLRLMDPQSNILATTVTKSKFNPEHRRMRNRVMVQGINLTGSGDYKILIDFKEDSDKKTFLPAAEIPLEVVINKE